MSRVATLSNQALMTSALARGQENVANTALQIGTAKKVQTYADLGADTRRMLTAATMRAQQQAQSDVAKRVGTTLSLYDMSLDGLVNQMMDLRTKLLNAIGQNNGEGVGQATAEAFTSLRTALNSSEAGVPIFAGGQTETLPFVPKSMDDLASLGSTADAFANDDVVASARIDGDSDIKYGITASQVGTGVLEAFRTLAALGPLSTTLTKSQSDTLSVAMNQLKSGIDTIKGVNGRNGDLRSHVDSLVNNAEQRMTVLDGVIGDDVDANLQKVATDLSVRTTALNASYAAFSRLSSLSLVNFLTP